MSLQKEVKLSFNLDQLKGYILNNQYELSSDIHGGGGDGICGEYFGGITIITEKGELNIPWFCYHTPYGSINLVDSITLHYDEIRIYNHPLYNKEFDFSNDPYNDIVTSFELLDKHTNWRMLAYNDIRLYQKERLEEAEKSWEDYYNNSN